MATEVAKKPARNGPLLTLALRSCTAFFSCMCLAHFFSFKKPLLFIYYDTPYYAYQDKIIAFCVAVYVLLFKNASKDPALVPTAIGSLLITTVGLSLVNVSEALSQTVSAQHTFTPYWLQTGAIGALTAALYGLYKSNK